MKRLFCTWVIFSSCCLFGTVQAQENAPERRTPQASRGERVEEKTSGLPDLTLRAQDLNQRLNQDIGNARWMRIVYRNVDLMKEENAPLYYPTRPMNGNMNLFMIIFQLMCDGKITAYQYQADYEIFEDEYKVNFKEEVLDRANIYYDEIPGRAGEPASFIINESDIPSADVRSYYVKEAWYFDQNNSVFDVKTLAICPILSYAGDFGDQTMALFWLPYENIRPYISNTYIMTSNLNNAKTFTMEDFFRRRMFDGEIIKTENLMNLTLQQAYPEPDSLRLAQEEIEKQLGTFRQSLYWTPDTTQVAAANTKKAAKANNKTVRAAKTTSAKESSGSTKAPKAEKSSGSAPVRSVRRR